MYKNIILVQSESYKGNRQHRNVSTFTSLVDVTQEYYSTAGRNWVDHNFPINLNVMSCVYNMYR